MNKYLLITFLFLSASSTHADEIKNFVAIPETVTPAKAVSIVAKAAISRQWSIQILNNKDNRLRIKLNHRNYKAVLDFTFSGDMITYIDSTTFLDEGEDAFGETTNAWVTKKTPSSWMRNLKKDTKKLFMMNEIDNSSSD